MRYLKAWLLGAVAVALLAGAAVAVLSSVAASGAVSDLRIAAWGVVLVEVETVAKTTETTIGPALPLLALIGGVVNAVILGVIVRREREDGPIA